MDVWTISKSGLLIRENEPSIMVERVRACRQLGRVQVCTETREELELNLKDFQPPKDVPFEQNNKISRSAFLKWVQSHSNVKVDSSFAKQPVFDLNDEEEDTGKERETEFNEQYVASHLSEKYNGAEEIEGDYYSNNGYREIQEVESHDPPHDSAIFNRKLLGKNILVPVENLVQPAATRAVRDIDCEHVKELEKQFEISGKTFGILLGVVTGKGCVSVEDLTSKGRCNIEVIGGNHTRQAIFNINKRRNIINYITMDVYEGLTDQESIRLGLLHNSQHEHSKATSFEDKVKLFRRLYNVAETTYADQPKKCKMIHRDMVADVVGIEKKKVKNTLEAHLQVSTLPCDVWELFQDFVTAWKQKKISGQPKTPLRQTHVKRLLSFKSNEEQKIYLQDLIDNRINFRNENTKRDVSTAKVEELEAKYLKAHAMFKTAEEKNQIQDRKIKEMETAINRHECDDNTKMKKELITEQEKVKDLQQTIEQLRKAERSSSEKNRLLQRENADLRIQLVDLKQRLEHAEAAAARARKLQQSTARNLQTVQTNTNTVINSDNFNSVMESSVVLECLSEQTACVKRTLYQDGENSITQKKKKSSTKEIEERNTNVGGAANGPSLISEKEIAVVEWTKNSVYLGLLGKQQKLTFCKKAIGVRSSLNFGKRESQSINYKDTQRIDFDYVICSFIGKIEKDEIILDNTQKKNIMRDCHEYFKDS